MTTRLRGIAAATLIASASMAGFAQTKPATPAASAATAATATATRPASGYASAFDGYRPFTEQKVLSWRESNDLVGRIGGWQAYAREAAGGEAMPADQKGSPTPGASPTPVNATPAAKSASTPSNSSNDPHGGHVMPKKP